MSRSAAALALAATLLLAPVSAAVLVDGTLDAAYGPALVTQTTQTDAGDAAQGALEYARGSELDQGFAFAAEGVLYLFLSGNLAACCPWEFSVEHALEIFIDSKPGGQNRLRADNQDISPNGNLSRLAGLTFDAGFAPDYWLGRDWVSAYYSELPTDSGAVGYRLGRIEPGGPGLLTGGTNPHGILASHDQRNTAGVTAGCGSASGAGVTTGLEWAVPLAAIGDPDGCIRVCAFVAGGRHDYVWNQVLGPLPPGTCSLGAPSGVDFAAVAGDQHFALCDLPIPVRGLTWGRLKTLYR